MDFNTTIDFIKSKTNLNPQIGIILGTGLNNLWKIVQQPVIIDYKDIPGFVVSTAPSHSGKLIIGKIGDKEVIMLQGRFHFYEGYTMEQVTYPVRVFAKLGVKYLIVTNAAGSLNQDYGPGSLVMLSDHINFMGTNPLIGKNMDEFGERFPSMHSPFDKELRTIARNIAKEKEIKLSEGVYVAVTGPSLETRSECLMLKNFGADVVGMSTVPEVIVAVHSGLRVFGCSVVTNYSNMFHDKPHSQEEIRKFAEIARTNLEEIITALIEKI